MEEEIDRLLDGGFIVVYTDGLAEIHATIGGIVWYGVHSECGISILAPLPTDFRQAINTAALYGAVQALRSTSAARVAVCTDSSYVHSGATGAAFRRRARGSVESAQCCFVGGIYRNWKIRAGLFSGSKCLLMLVLNATHRRTCLQIKAGWPTPLNPPQQQNAQHGGPIRGHPQKRRETEFGPSPCGTEFLSANNTAIILQSLGLEVMRDLPPDHGNISELDECDADVDGFSSSDTASTCSNYYSSE